MLVNLQFTHNSIYHLNLTEEKPLKFALKFSSLQLLVSCKKGTEKHFSILCILYPLYH